MQLPLTTHPPLESRSQQLLTRRLLPLFIAAFSQGLVLYQVAARLPLLDRLCALRATLWSGEQRRRHFSCRMDGGWDDAACQRLVGQSGCRQLSLF